MRCHNFPKQFRELALFIRDLLMKGSIALSQFQAIISTNNSVTLLAFRAPDTGSAVHQSTFVDILSRTGHFVDGCRASEGTGGFHYAWWSLLLR